MNEDKFLGCILGVAVGDALGVPFETMTYEEIADSRADITKYHVPGEVNPHSFPEVRTLPPGTWSDDTQLTLAVMEAIIEAGGMLDMDIIARKHAEAFKEHMNRGWGRSTYNSCERLLGGVSWRESGEPDGNGNGVMMKIAPLGLAAGLGMRNFRSPRPEWIEFAKMTHLAVPAIAAGYVHAKAISLLSSSTTPIALGDFLAYVVFTAVEAEKLMKDKKHLLSDYAWDLRKEYISGRLFQGTPLGISSRYGGGTWRAFTALNSFGSAYAAFVRHPDSFEAVYEAIRIGGDTDTNASIVGSLLGALHGSKIIPPELRSGLEGETVIVERTRTFFATVSGRR